MKLSTYSINNYTFPNIELFRFFRAEIDENTPQRPRVNSPTRLIRETFPSFTIQVAIFCTISKRAVQ